MSKPSDYQVVAHLGSGSYGTCSKVHLLNDPSRTYAWKETDYNQFSDTQLQMLCQEVNLLRSLQHDNIVKFHGRLVDKSTGRLYVLMEYCQEGDLSTLIASFAGVHRLLPHFLIPEAFVRRVCAQLLSALQYCHSRNVIHRDLKPANVLLDNKWNAKLADFGLSRVLSSGYSLATTIVGTPMYMSPELLGEQELYDGFTTPKSDIWALGCVLHEMMALKAPFNAQSKPELRQKIRSGCHADLPVTFSPALRRLAADMLRVDHDKRPSAAELLATSEIRLWLAAASEMAWTNSAKAAAEEGDGCGGRGTDRRRAELLLMQTRLADKESKLAALEAELKDREKLLTEAEEKNKQQEAKLFELNKVLAEKQKLLPRLSACARGEDSVATSSARPRRHASTGSQKQQQQQQQQLKQKQPQQQQQQQQCQQTRLRIALSPITSDPQTPQNQQQLLERGKALVKCVKKVSATTANGRYVSPVATPPDNPQQRNQPGRYEPVLDLVTCRQKQLLKKCSPAT